jgi:hypothetical protein
MFTEEDTEKIKEMYREDFGIEISDEEAFEFGKSLIDLMRAVYGI